MGSGRAQRTALVTGGSRGIGLAVAEMLGELGYALTISGRQPEGLAATTARLADSGIEVQGVPAQMHDEDELVALVAAHVAVYNRLDVLINNAGVSIASRPDTVQPDDLETQLAVNFRGMVVTTRESLPGLRAAGAEHGKALIVNIASIMGKLPDPGLAVYSATKAAVIGYTVATQRDVRADGIQVSAFCPGFVDTDMTENVRDLIDRNAMIRPRDIAEGVRFLLSTSPTCLVPEITLLCPTDLE